MSKFDGTDEDLSYGRALAEIVERCSWPSEEHKAEVRDVILKQHKLYRAPEKVDDPKEIAQEKELAKLRAENQKLLDAQAARDRDAEVEKLKAENEKLAAAGSGSGKSSK